MTTERIEMVPLGELAAWPRNPKTHDVAALSRSVDRFGFVSPLIVDERTRRLVAGHGRLDALKALRDAGKEPPARVQRREDGEWLVPVVRGIAFNSDAEAEAYVLADNRLSEIGGWDGELLGTIIEDLPDDLAEIAGFDEDFVPPEPEVVEPEPKEIDDPGAVEPKQEAVARLGDVWVLGEHRLMCGDSTDGGAVAVLMDGQKAKLLATDPPYGVDYSKTKDGIPRSGFSNHQELWGDIENDGLTGAELQPFLESVFRAALPHLDRAAWYLWHAHLTQGFFAAAAAAAANVILHRQIIWKKPGFVLTRSGMYHWSHEPAFYGWVKGEQPEWYGPKNQSSVWEVGRDTDRGYHPTQKPIELFEIPMRNHTRVGDVCYEPFSGSGSQLIAGEHLSRRVFAMEIEPRYVDAAIRRWQKATGKTAMLAGTPYEQVAAERGVKLDTPEPEVAVA